MSLFLAEVAQRQAEQFIVMVMNQAGWYLAGDLVVPAKMRLIHLPPYSPEIKPTEPLREVMREYCFTQQVFADLDAVKLHSQGGSWRESNPGRTKSIAGFDWITSSFLNVNQQEQSHDLDLVGKIIL